MLFIEFSRNACACLCYMDQSIVENIEAIEIVSSGDSI